MKKNTHRPGRITDDPFGSQFQMWWREVIEREREINLRWRKKYCTTGFRGMGFDPDGSSSEEELQEESHIEEGQPVPELLVYELPKFGLKGFPRFETGGLELEGTKATYKIPPAEIMPWWGPGKMYPTTPQVPRMPTAEVYFRKVNPSEDIFHVTISGKARVFNRNAGLPRSVDYVAPRQSVPRVGVEMRFATRRKR